MSLSTGGMTPAQLAAYEAKRAREKDVRAQLYRRERECFEWLERNFNSLSHRHRLVKVLERLITCFKLEATALPPFEGSAFLRELVAEDYALWPEDVYGPYPLYPSARKEA